MTRSFPLNVCVFVIACAPCALERHAGADDRITRPAHADARPRAAQPSEPLIAVLRDALVSTSARERQEVMRSLAELRDPALRPLFVQLVQAPWPEVRMQAVLAAAQIEPSRGIDLLAVQRLESRTEQANLVAAAVARDLLAPGQLEDVARWKDLDDRLAVSIAGLLTAEGHPPAPQRLRAILDEPGSGAELRLHAALVLMQQGQVAVEPQARAMLDELLALPGAKADEALAGIMARVRRQRLEAALPILELIRARSADRPLRVFESLQTMLTVAPDNPGVLAAAAHDLDFKGENADDRAAVRARIALAMLEAAGKAPTRVTPALGALLDGDKDPFVVAVRGVLQALAEGGKAPASHMCDAVCTLVALRHPRALTWALDFARQRPWDEARAIRLAIVDQAAGSRSSHTLSFAATAATDVCDGDPEALRAGLKAAIKADDRVLIFVLLTGCLKSVNPAVSKLLQPAAGAAGQPADAPWAWPDAGCSALADLAIARHAATGSLTPEQCDRIERIALGEGELPTVYRLQAAWLALKARDQDRVALARLLADAAPAEPAPPPPTPRGTP